MYETENITDVLIIESRFLTKNVETVLLNQLNEKIQKYKTEKKCYKKGQYIISITNFKICYGHVEMELNKFVVNYDAIVINVKKDSIFTADQVISAKNQPKFQGIIVSVMNLFHILIMNGSIVDQFFVFKNCDCRVPIVPCLYTLSNIIIEKVMVKNSNCFVLGKHEHN